MNNAIINIAFLESLQASKRGDYIDHFVPFLAFVLENDTNEKLTVDNIKEYLENEFRIKIPLHVLQIIIGRAKKNKLLEQKGGGYLKNQEVIREVSEKFNKRRQEIVDAQKKFFKKFQDYSKEKFNLPIEIENINEIFFNYIIQFKVDALQIVQHLHDPRIRGKSLNNPNYLVTSFIKYLYDSQDDQIANLEQIIKGFLIANYLAFDEFSLNKKRFPNIKLYLDTPIVLGLFGYNGNAFKKVAVELLNLVQSLKIHVILFKETIVEIENIFDAWIRDLAKGNLENFKDHTIRVFKAQGYDIPALRTHKIRLIKSINQLKINIEDETDLDTLIGFDDNGFEKFLESTEKDRNFSHDVRCVSKVYRMRGVKFDTNINQDVTLFVTNNARLVRAGKKFIGNTYGTFTVPIIASDMWVATLAWTLRGSEFPNLAKNLIIANCYATLFTDDKFWTDFVKRMKRLKDEGKIDENDYNLIRYDVHLRDAANELAVSFDDEYSEESIYELVDKVKKRIFKGKDKEIKKLHDDNVKIKNKINSFSSFIAFLISGIIFLAITIAFVFGFYNAYENENSLSSIIFLVLCLLNFALGFSLLKYTKRIYLIVKNYISKQFE